MSNGYFRFKEFTVQQDRCAMKITTDACLLGAWTPLPATAGTLLDIGAGTGLLALMAAQRNLSLQIDAIEMDTEAAGQAAENVSAAPWAGRITVLEGDVCTYNVNKKYDVIITNPPFFNSSLLGPDSRRNAARHTHSLSYTALLQVVATYLSPGGYLSILLPATEFATWQQLALQNGWHNVGQLDICHRPDSTPKRIIGLFSRQNSIITSQEKLYIYTANNQYSEAFTHLLRPYYLAL